MREYLNEQGYLQSMEHTVMPALNACRQDGTFEGFGGARLRYSLFLAKEPRGSVVIVHGFTETAEKYREMIYYFLKEGYTVCVFDQRGHGRSPRTAPQDVTHVDRFDEYVEDLHALVLDVGRRLPAPHVLFCHSMGGAVGALYLIRRPGYFDKVVLSSPMLAAKHGGVALPLCRLICRFCMATGRSKKRIFVSRKPVSVKDETLSRSASDSDARFSYYRALREGDPELCGGGPSYGWAYAALGVTREILRRGAPEHVEIPVLLFSAERDTLVKRRPQEEFIARVPHGKFVSVPTKHEIYASADKTLFPYLDEIFDFLNAPGPDRPPAGRTCGGQQASQRIRPRQENTKPTKRHSRGFWRRTNQKPPCVKAAGGLASAVDIRPPAKLQKKTHLLPCIRKKGHTCAAFFASIPQYCIG